jgi:hypothetical protein
MATAPAKKAVAKSTVSKSRSPAVTKPKATVDPVKPAAKSAKVVQPAAKKTTSGNGALKAPVSKAKAKPVAELKEKVKKAKLVRDSFTMPEPEYQVLGDMKKACLKAGFAVKKSELLRAGVALIQKMEVAKLQEIIAALPPLKAGRPKKDK